MQGWFLNTLFSALKIALKLFSIYLSSTSHFRIAWSIALRAPSLFFFFFFYSPAASWLLANFSRPGPEAGETGKPSSKHHKREFLFFPSPLKRRIGPTCCVSMRQRPFHGIAFVMAGVRNPQIFFPTDLLFLCKDWFNSWPGSTSQSTLFPNPGPSPVSFSGFCLF